MSNLWIGILGFGAIILHDLNNLSHNNERLDSLYVVGGGLIGLSLLYQVAQSLAAGYAASLAIKIPFGILAGLFFLLLCYVSLFVGKRTNFGRKLGDGDPWWEKELADRGLYALCRHPSVWFFVLMTLCLVPAAGLPYSSAVIFNTAALLLAYYEDRNVFPEIVQGYDKYKRRVPFLLPTGESIRRCRETWKKKP